MLLIPSTATVLYSNRYSRGWGVRQQQVFVLSIAYYEGVDPTYSKLLHSDTEGAQLWLRCRTQQKGYVAIQLDQLRRLRTVSDIAQHELGFQVPQYRIHRPHGNRCPQP